MLFNNQMNERLLAFARNIAAIVFIGGLALLVIYRAETMKPIETYQYIGLFCFGVIILFWSMYLAICNVTVLYHDYREYLLECLKEEKTDHTLNEKELKSTSKIIWSLAQQSWIDTVIYFFRFLVISLIGFSFVFLYFLGIWSILNQQAKVFGF